MNSPFPGVDPYLEPHWPDLYARATTYLADLLNERLPDDLVASTVVRPQPNTERCVRILELGTDKVIAAIDFVTPPSKEVEGLERFVRRRQRLLTAGANIVEIDLGRTGDWESLLLPHEAPCGLTTTPYRIAIWKASEMDTVELYPVLLRERLPVIRIPLRQGDSTVIVELQVLFDQLYQRGRYSRRINYRRDPEPALDAADAAWAVQLLIKAGKR